MISAEVAALGAGGEGLPVKGCFTEELLLLLLFIVLPAYGGIMTPDSYWYVAVA